MIYKLLKPILFSFEPEFTHDLISNILKKTSKISSSFKRLFTYESHHLKRTIWNIEFPNILGLAAGFDKTGELYEVLSYFGFGFIECGTFTPLPQDGNPKPRLFRYPEKLAIVNRMGFNNPGIEKAKQIFQHQKKIVPRGINIGKNKNTPINHAINDYLDCFNELYPFADYIVINVSSPNTPNLRELQESNQILELIRYLKKRKEELETTVPILIKLSPDLTETQFYQILENYIANGIDGIVLTNTTIERNEFYKHFEPGGLSGLPLKEISTKWIKKAFQFTEGKIPIIGVGGIFNSKDALEKIMAGASLIQIYTALIYEGPFLIKNILQEIDEFLYKENTNLLELTGIQAK